MYICIYIHITIFFVFTGPVVIDGLHNNLCTTYKKNRCKPAGAEWPPNQPKSIVSVAVMHYRGGRTRQELFEIAKRHKEGSYGIDKVVSSHCKPPAAKKKKRVLITPG